MSRQLLKKRISLTPLEQKRLPKGNIALTGQAGVTLIETLVVVMLIAILAAVTMPRLGISYVTKMKVKTAAGRLMADLRHTRRLAITNNENHTLSVDSIANEYSITDSSATQAGITRSIDSDITISADKDFIFTSLGSIGGGSDTTISLSADGNQFDITVTTATGRISVTGP